MADQITTQERELLEVILKVLDYHPTAMTERVAMVRGVLEAVLEDGCSLKAATETCQRIAASTETTPAVNGGED